MYQPRFEQMTLLIQLQNVIFKLTCLIKVLLEDVIISDIYNNSALFMAAEC